MSNGEKYGYESVGNVWDVSDSGNTTYSNALEQSNIPNLLDTSAIDPSDSISIVERPLSSISEDLTTLRNMFDHYFKQDPSNPSNPSTPSAIDKTELNKKIFE